MFTDIVIPDSKPEIFTEIAERVGYQYLIFAVRNKQEAEMVKAVAESHKGGKVSVGIALVGNANARLPNLALLSCNAADMRKVFENERDALIVVNCRLDQVACASAVKNKNVVCFSIGDVTQGNPGNTIWNIKLCRRYSVKTAIASFAKSPLDIRAPADTTSLFTCLGMEPGMARKSLQVVGEMTRKDSGIYLLFLGIY